MNLRRSAPWPRPDRGAVLITALILAAIISISLVSYIRLGRTSLTVSSRALYHNAAMNLAENGMEEAMYSINKKVADSSYSWSSDGWTVIGTTAARRKWTGTQFDQNTTGEVRVYVFNHDGGGSPFVIARSLVTPGGSASTPIEKWVTVQLRRTSKFANGLVAKETITFSGNNASVDSWNSDPDNDSSTAAIKYSAGVRRDNGSVGSVSVSVGSILVQNADIWGYAATGGALPTVGANGLVGPFGTPSGTMDMSRVSTDFTANFDPVTQPAGGTGIAAITGATTIGTSGVASTFWTTHIALSGGPGTNLVIKGEVTLYLTAPATQSAIDITGNGGIVIEPGAKLIVYTAGNIKIAGNGVLNGGNAASTANQPINFQVWGTSTHPSQKQDIQIAGNGVLSGIAYAPNGSLTINGNGDVMGSFVANDIKVTGNAAFHYDESLGNFGGGNPFRVTRWNELTAAAERAAYNPIMTW
ncbi:MAG: hypothetical protein HZC55_06145 [Verrucomicrobia bacterium]|nr:hypothetical protein [Verrucomicrobiota bacterium]